ncbi:MAG: PepSY-like domain-containing protein [Bacteroidales bacterium]
MTKTLTQTFIFNVLALGIITCVPEHLEDHPIGILPNENVLQSFMKDNPNAEGIEWSISKDYYVADFYAKSVSSRAWFNNRGECLLYMAQYSLGQLDRKISDALSGSRFAGWEIVTIRLLKRKDMGTVYKVRLRNNEKYASLYFAPSGCLIRMRFNRKEYVETPVIIPETLTQKLQARFDRPEIIDLWQSNSMSNAAVMDDSICKIASFSDTGEWTRTVWHIAQDRVPQIVILNFKQSKHGAEAVIDETRMVQAPNGFSYMIYYSDSQGRHVAHIMPTGVIKSIVSYKE